MADVKVFLDHLVFSVLSVGFVAVLLHLAIRAVDDSTPFDEHIWIMTGLCLAVALSLAGFLTYRTIKGRPSDEIVYTRRES